MATLDGSLETLGLTRTEERVYRLLVRRAADSPRSLATACGLDPEQIRTAVAGLRAHGLVAVTGSDGDGRLEPVAPQVALADLVLAREHGLHRARIALEDLTATYRQHASQDDAGVVTAVHGPDEVARWFSHLQRVARSELLGFVKPPYIAVTTPANVAEEVDMRNRGVHNRVVVERAVLADTAAHDELIAALDRGQELRVTAELPLKLLIADRSLALVPLSGTPDGAVGALVVRSSGLLEALLALFELVWEHSTRLRPDLDPMTESRPAGAAPSAEDRRILTLLLAGHTDEVIADRLGMGYRTVQRRIRAIMDAVGARTRLQLGWHARDRGWL